MTTTHPLHPLFKFFAGFKLSVSILFAMFVLTWLGTLAQVDIGLYQSQKKYFESWVVFQPFIGPATVPLPGGALLMVLLAINLALGGMVRLRKSWTRAGILTTHIGIALLLIAGAVKFRYSSEGHMMLFEGQRSSEYVSYHDWEIAIHEEMGSLSFSPAPPTQKEAELRQFLPQRREWVVPQSAFVDRTGERVAEVRAPELPFRIEISGFTRNCEVLPKGPMFTPPQPVVDGYFVQPRRPEIEAEQDLAGCYVRVLPEDGPELDGILWGAERHPLPVRAAGREYGLTLRKQRFPVPFEIELTRFTHEYHPGTMMPRVFKSDIVVRQGGTPEPMLIEMNAPLRRDGVIAFQSSWGPQGARPGDRLFSVFTVVENPSDQWPLWACIVIGVGMFMHFGFVLVRYIRSETKVAR